MWPDVLEILKTEINLQSFNWWLKDTELIDINYADAILTVKASEDVAKKHILEKFVSQIDSAVEKVLGKKYLCNFVTENPLSKHNWEFSSNSSGDNYVSKKMNDNLLSELVLNPNYSFENFVRGPNNEYALAASLSVAEHPASGPNPLFIYGSSGLGKTHLLQAIGNYVKNSKPYLKVMFVKTELFTTEFINSIRNNTTESFKIKYRNVDVLLVDDIQFLANKEQTQEEFFYTFETLHNNKKQIVISSDVPPKQIPTLTERLRTRFEWGIITDIQTPTLETREAILRKKAEIINVKITDDAYIYIAQRIKSSIRGLESAVNRLKMVSDYHSDPITIEHCKLHLKELFDVDATKKVTILDIMKKVSTLYNVSVDEMKSSSRHSRLIRPRFMAMYLSRTFTDLTTSDIGREFERDHSTVVNAVNKIEELIKEDPQFKEIIDDVSLELRS